MNNTAENLKRMGKAWFIVYTYYLKINSSETRWRNVDLGFRISYYEACKADPVEFANALNDVKTTPVSRMTNKMGVSLAELRMMQKMI